MNDNPEQLKLGWTVREYIGSEVWKESAPEQSLTNEADIQAGDVIICPGLWNENLKMLIKKDSYGVLYGDCGHLTVVLCFDKDDRHCWTTGGFVNKRAIEKLTKGLIID